MESLEIDWQANIWFVERLNISQEGYNRSNMIDSFSFLDIKCVENRKGLQKYLKYFLTVTSLIWELFVFIILILGISWNLWKNITDMDTAFIKEYFDRLAM